MWRSRPYPEQPAAIRIFGYRRMLIVTCSFCEILGYTTPCNAMRGPPCMPSFSSSGAEDAIVQPRVRAQIGWQTGIKLC